MSTTTTSIYSLLPAVFRTRDAALGGPLQALFQVLEDQHGLVKDNVWQLYNDQFIETCAPWAIPYIGQLIGFDPVYTTALVSPDSRAEVANTIGYRRRKGTLVALEQVTADVSGRSTMAVEEFKRLVTTLSLRDVSSQREATADLRHGEKLEDQQGPFTQLNRTVDVRNIAPRTRVPAAPDAAPLDIALHGPGRFNIPEVAVWMWRWQSFAISNAPAFAFRKGGYFFSSFGAPIPLFQPAQAESAPFSRLTTEAVVPEPIRRRRFRAKLSDFYPSALSPDGQPVPATSALSLVADGQLVPASQIVCANLSPRPDGSICEPAKGKIAIDPERGQIQYAADLTLPKDLRVNYSYGAPAAIGGGPYDRDGNIVTPSNQPNTEFVNSANPFQATVGTAQYPTLESAVQAWNGLKPNSAGLILLQNFEALSIDLTGPNAIQIPAQSVLMIASASVTGTGKPEWKNACVALRGDIEIVAPAVTLGADGIPLSPGQVQINGVWLNGRLKLSGAEATVQLTDCTLTPGLARNAFGEADFPGEASVTGSGGTLAVTLGLNRVVSGPILLTSTSSARITNSIIDAEDRYAVAFAGPDKASPGPSLHIEESTVIGRVYAQTLRMASNTLFLASRGKHDPWQASVWAQRVQTGCVRFCWLPSDSITPSPYECLPPAASQEAALQPQFVSLRFGDPSFCLLSGYTPVAVWKGADNGSQIGVYYQIQETEAVTNIQIRSAEYLPANLQCGVFLIPSHACPEAAPQFEYAYGYAYGAKGELPMGIGVDLI